MKNNIIIVDLDRTLLHTDKSVSDYTIQTLKKCKNNDMKILVATGRPLRNTTYYHNLINFDSLVLSNGARIITKNKEILNSIDKESAKNIISILNEHNLTITIETLDKAYSNKMINNYESTISNDLNDVIDKNEILKINEKIKLEGYTLIPRTTNISSALPRIWKRKFSPSSNTSITSPVR